MLRYMEEGVKEFAERLYEALCIRRSEEEKEKSKGKIRYDLDATQGCVYLPIICSFNEVVEFLAMNMANRIKVEKAGYTVCVNTGSKIAVVQTDAETVLSVPYLVYETGV